MSKLLNDQLRKASAAGNENAVDSLLDRGADIHADDDYALRCAAANCHTATVALLLKRGNCPPKAVTKARACATARAGAKARGQSEVVALIDAPPNIRWC